jgi:hypothetical protein
MNALSAQSHISIEEIAAIPELVSAPAAGRWCRRSAGLPVHGLAKVRISLLSRQDGRRVDLGKRAG